MVETAALVEAFFSDLYQSVGIELLNCRVLPILESDPQAINLFSSFYLHNCSLVLENSRNTFTEQLRDYRIQNYTGAMLVINFEGDCISFIQQLMTSERGVTPTAVS